MKVVNTLKREPVKDFSFWYTFHSGYKSYREWLTGSDVPYLSRLHILLILSSYQEGQREGGKREVGWTASSRPHIIHIVPLTYLWLKTGPSLYTSLCFMCWFACILHLMSMYWIIVCTQMVDIKRRNYFGGDLFWRDNLLFFLWG